MQANNCTLVTIVTESSLEATLSRELEKLEVHGYTITDARGKGTRGSRDAKWDADSNIRIEVLCKEATADSIIDFLQREYYDNFAMITYRQSVFVLRPEKFS